MKKIPFIALLLLISFRIFPQSYAYDTANAGTAKILTGNTYVLICFISDRNNQWRNNEKMNAIAKYNEATGWLKTQARNYGVRIDFESGTYGLDSDIKLNYIEYGTASGNEDVEIVSTVLNQLGYYNDLSFYDWVLNNTNCSNALVLLYVKGAGIGYAIPQYQYGNNELLYMEGIVLYDRFPDGQNGTSASIAHEILHLFGAWDLYATFQQTKEAESYARMHFPNSIMLRVSHNINELTVDPLTAWRIGWNHNPEPWYAWFDPDN